MQQLSTIEIHYSLQWLHSNSKGVRFRINKMSARYSRIPTEDEMESGYAGLTFDYSSAFTFDSDSSRNYKSAFTYSDRSDLTQLGDDLRFEIGMF